MLPEKHTMTCFETAAHFLKKFPEDRRKTASLVNMGYNTDFTQSLYLFQKTLKFREFSKKYLEHLLIAANGFLASSKNIFEKASVITLGTFNISCHTKEQNPNLTVIESISGSSK